MDCMIKIKKRTSENMYLRIILFSSKMTYALRKIIVVEHKGNIRYQEFKTSNMVEYKYGHLKREKKAS